ncbi:MAG: xanthine phosphoribosyltransferase [Oscillospiraceae bacterium]
MKALEEKILREGKVLPGNVVKVGGFLNQRLDVEFLMEMGREIAKQFAGEGVTKVITVEASGIALAVAAAAALHVPAAFAKKHASANLSGDLYTAEVFSYTHQKSYTIMMSREYLTASDRVLIVDDFLACGNAVGGLMKMVEEAGATLVGVSAAIEKGFQGGGDALRAKGVRVESLAIIEKMDDHSITFRA